MRIRYLSLHVGSDCFNKNFAVQFNANVNFINDFLSKAARKMNLPVSIPVNMISISLTSGKNTCDIIPENVLLVTIHVSSNELSKYLSMSNLVDRYEFYLSLLERGYKYADSLYRIPVSQLLDINDMFRQNNYLDEWLTKKIYISEYGISVNFISSFTTFDYHLSVQVYSRTTKRIVLETELVRLYPHWVCFEKDFKKIYLQETTIIAEDCFGKVNFRLSVHQLVRGIVDIEYSSALSERMKIDNEDIERTVIW